MTIHSATDHGYTTDWAIKVAPGLVVTHHSAEGDHQLHVLRRHRAADYWECVWLDGPRQHAYWIRSEREILADAYA